MILLELFAKLLEERILGQNVPIIRPLSGRQSAGNDGARSTNLRLIKCETGREKDGLQVLNLPFQLRELKPQLNHGINDLDGVKQVGGGWVDRGAGWMGI